MHRVWIVPIAAFLLFCLVHALRSALLLPTYHLDGAFQTASGLYRLADGQWPGRDFLPYLGIGPLLSLYPIFALAGSDLFASVLAAQLMTMLLGWLTLTVTLHFAGGLRTPTVSAALGALLYLGLLALSARWGTVVPPDFIAQPGNSLRLVRAAAPALTALAMCLVLTRCPPGKRRAASLGLIGGSVLLWSNDYAVPTLAVFSLVLVRLGWHSDRRRWLGQGAIYGLTVAFTYGLWLVVTTAGHGLAMLRYNYRDVAGDQWWFFGGYARDSRVFTLADVDKLLAWPDHLHLFVLAWVVLVALRGDHLRDLLLAGVGLATFAGGLVATVFGHVGVYFVALRLWSMVTLVGLAGRSWARRSRIPQRRALWAERLVAGAAVVATASALVVGVVGLVVAHGAHRDDPGLFFVPELGGYLDRAFQPYVARLRGLAPETVVVEEYWGLAGALRRRFSPWPVDATIHALGRTRVTARAALLQADRVVTTRYRASRKWQPWNLTQNYWFYGPLLWSWEPVGKSPTTVVWRRRGKPLVGADVPCRLEASRRAFVLVGAMPGFYEVALAYRLARPARRLLLLVRNNISYAKDAGGYASLNPAGSEAILPVRVTRGRAARFDLVARGRAGAVPQLLSCTARAIPFEDPDVLNTPGRARAYRP